MGIPKNAAQAAAFIAVFVLFSCNNRLVGAHYQFSLAQAQTVSQGLESDGGVPGELFATGPTPGSMCTKDSDACTPYNLAGRIYAGGAMWGEMGPGGNAQSITLIGATPEIVQNPSKGTGGTLKFSLVEGTTLSSQHWAPEASAPEKPLSRMEFLFDYLDATVKVEVGSGLDGTYVVRTVFVAQATADDVTGTMQKGDKLVKAPSETQFKWCGTNGCFADRASVNDLVLEPSIVNYQFPGQGNPQYVNFTVPLKNQLRLSGAQLNAKSQLWTLYFDMKNAVKWKRSLSEVKTVTELVDAFKLSHGSSEGLGATQETDISVNLVFSQP